jgi:hypothetical protein
MLVKIITHYEASDKDCGGEYTEVSIWVDNRLVQQYGDYYHDKGEERAEAFVDGIRHCVDHGYDTVIDEPLQLIEESRADTFYDTCDKCLEEFQYCECE